MAFSFNTLITSSETSTKPARWQTQLLVIFKMASKVAILKIIQELAEYGAILNQGEHENFYTHLSNILIFYYKLLIIHYFTDKTNKSCKVVIMQPLQALARLCSDYIFGFLSLF